MNTDPTAKTAPAGPARRALPAGLVACALGLSVAAASCAPNFKSAYGVEGGKVNRLAVSGDLSDAPLVFAFYSDPEGNGAIHARVCAEILRWSPAFTVMGGDCVFDASDAFEWVDFLETSTPLRETLPFLPVRGNHDDGHFERLFSLPGGMTYYSLDLGPAHFTVIDTELPFGPGTPQGDWLRADLEAAAGRPFTLVFHHKQVLSSGEYYASGHTEQELLLEPLFRSLGVEVSFSGHEHFYERLAAGGVQYVVSGGGGQGLRDRAFDHPASVRFSGSHHYCIGTVTEDVLVVEVHDLSGGSVDAFAVRSR